MGPGLVGLGLGSIPREKEELFTDGIQRLASWTKRKILNTATRFRLHKEMMELAN